MHPPFPTICLVAVLVCLAVSTGCDRSTEAPDPATQHHAAVFSAAPPTEVVAFCGNCHKTPSPKLFPKDAWQKEVKRGFDFYTESRRTDLQIPGMNGVVAWYRSQAPDVLQEMHSLPESSGSVLFEKQSIPSPPNISPMVSQVTWDSRSPRLTPELRLTDMGSGHVCEIQFGEKLQHRQILQAANPACSITADLNNDGIADLLIADLGSQGPADHEKGALLYLQGAPEGSAIEPAKASVRLLENVGRIAHVDAADFDGDGDLDLVVAEFGWQKSGSILLLENVSHRQADGQFLVVSNSFKPHCIDSRHGTIHVPVCDLNGDGIPDFVALVSQEHETIDAYLGNGDLTFRKETLNPAEDPSFGSCGIELVDIEQDGDLDVVYCNGDNLDALLIKDYHGVKLLINEGTFPFRSMNILSLAGASATATADFDGDGDLDIAVTGFLPPQLHEQLSLPTYDSLCWLEQTGPGVFLPHSIEKSLTGHLSITVGDFNNDKAVDIAVGNFPGDEWGAVWWNRHSGNGR